EEIASSPNGLLEECNIYQEIFSIGLDATARCTLNIKVKNPRSPDNDFQMALRELFPESQYLVAKLLKLFPELTKFMGLFMSKKPEGFFVKTFQQVYGGCRSPKYFYAMYTYWSLKLSDKYSSQISASSSTEVWVLEPLLV
ncbi:unnamed protein product, partial [Allacma fusca]